VSAGFSVAAKTPQNRGKRQASGEPLKYDPRKGRAIVQSKIQCEGPTRLGRTGYSAKHGLAATRMTGMRFDRARHQGPAASSLLVLSILTLALYGNTSPACAEETTNPFNSMFGLFGGKPDKDETDTIDYRPRAPLVVPPTRDLPEPKEAVRDPAWPKDADANAQRRAALDSRRRVPQPSPNAGAGTTTNETQAKAPAPAKPDEHEGECLLNDSGPRSCFNVMQSVFGGASTNDAVKPGTEPQRKLLIEPPPGYRTATVSPRTAEDKAKNAADQGPLDSFLEVFGMKKSSDN
jgi:hypothetical protein